MKLGFIAKSGTHIPLRTYYSFSRISQFIFIPAKQSKKMKKNMHNLQKSGLVIIIIFFIFVNN